jgi:tripartite-type tricarboxylate transporter receptor subunit TctC
MGHFVDPIETARMTKTQLGFTRHLTVLGNFFFVLLMCSATTAQAQNYPNKPIRVIVPWPAGGLVDVAARQLSNRLQTAMGQPIVIDNKLGAGGNVGADQASKAAADGYTMLFTSSALTMSTAMRNKMPFDAVKDLERVAVVAYAPSVLVVNQNSNITTVQELIKAASANPGKLSYGSAGLGTLQHVWGAILVKQLGLDMLHVPFKGAAPAHQEMLGGRVDIMFDNLSASKGYVQSAKMKGLAVSSVARSAALPQVPTVNETGVTRFEGESWFGIFVPAATPAPILARLREALLSVTRDKDFVARVERDGGRVLDLSPTQQQAFMRDEIDRWSKLVTQYGVTAD